MTHDAVERSATGGNPIELYDFTVGSASYHFTTTSRQGLEYTTDGNHTYEPAVINRTQPKVNNDQPGSQLQIELATNHPATQEFCRLWVANAPESNNAFLKLSRVHYSDGEVYPFWFGFISSVEYTKNGTRTIVLCRALSDLFTMEGPRFNWSTSCNHQLFDSMCTLSRGDFVHATTVASGGIASDGITITLDDVPDPTVRWDLGELSIENEPDSRQIVSRSGNVIVIQYPLENLVEGSAVEIAEGCELNATDCDAFSNILNFGGTPYTPQYNPFTKGLDYEG